MCLMHGYDQKTVTQFDLIVSLQLPLSTNGPWRIHENVILKQTKFSFSNYPCRIRENDILKQTKYSFQV